MVGYLRDTQPEAWDKLERLNGAATEQLVPSRLVKALENDGTLEALRAG